MNSSGNIFSESNDTIDFVAEIKYYLFFWPWFVLSIVLFLSGCFTYLRYADVLYQTTATLQVKDAKSDPSSFITQGTAPMFNFNSVKIDNFLALMGSKPIMATVVDKLDLQIKVYKNGRIKDELVFQDQIPFNIVFKTEKVFGPENIKIELKNDNVLLTLNNTVYQSKSDKTIEFEDFDINFKKKFFKGASYSVQRISRQSAINKLQKSVSVSSSDTAGDNIDISIAGTNIQRNEAVITSLIKAVHQDQVSDKQQVYSLSIDFINNRLKTIKNEIDSLSLNTTNFKSNNLIFSPTTQTENVLSSMNTAEQEKFNLTTQMDLAKSLKENLKNQKDFSLLPSNIGINNISVNELVYSYNSLVLERDNLMSSATLKNPLIVQLGAKLKDLKRNILSSIDNYTTNIQIKLSNYKGLVDDQNSEISRIPELEATLIAFQRRFEIAQNLYLFLLQRREEASIRFESTLPDTRVINNASTAEKPIFPKSKIIILGFTLISIIIPFVILYVLRLIDTKFHIRDDIEKVLPNLDILGEVPFVDDVNAIIKDSRGVFAESTRVIRSNINFKLPNQATSKVILCTSSIKGEGKTICAFNIAASYSATGKKVILLGADLRNPQLHSILEIDRDNRKGLSSSAVSENHTNVSESIMSYKIFNNSMDILFSGPIPPNPAEILGSLKCFDIINSLKKVYDVVVIDSAPLVLVSDTLPLLKLADLVLYSIRAHYTDVKLAPFIRGLVDDKKIDNIGIVFNGIKAGGSSYYKYGYGYRYSYHSRYNYGYGYGYGEENDLSNS